MTVAAGIVPDSAGAEVSLRDVLAAALDANRELARLTAGLRAENARLRAEKQLLRAENAEQAAELAKLRADLAVLQRMVFGRSTERPGPGGGSGGEQEQGREHRNGKEGKRGPGARAGRRDYSHLPRFEVFWDFRGAGTAARNAGSRSRCWAIPCPGSSWTGR